MNDEVSRPGDPDLARQDLLADASEDLASIIDLTRALVATPSRGGIDFCESVLDLLGSWLVERGLAVRQLVGDDGQVLALTCEVRGALPGPRWVLDACVDTAPFGDESAWTHSPTSAVIENGWLHGRGSSDSKVGAAIFSHLAVRLARTTSSLRGTLVLLFDADEHTGDFGGAQRYFEGLGAPTDVAGVVIGYPGMDELVVGGRGVCRAKLTVYGRAAHSGSTSSAPNAVVKAADLVHALSTAELPVAGAFPLPAKLTVTTIAGGESFSIVPDRCELSVDVRTTPTFDPGAAIAMMRNLIAEVDAGWPGTRTSNLDLVAAWPAYSLPEDAPLRAALLDAANAFGLDLPARVAGPSNIGNYLAGLGIPATAGFGVDYIGLHGTDERIRVDSIPVILAVHHAALLRLMSQRRQSPEGKEQP